MTAATDTGFVRMRVSKTVEHRRFASHADGQLTEPDPQCWASTRAAVAWRKWI